MPTSSCHKLLSRTCGAIRLPPSFPTRRSSDLRKLRHDRVSIGEDLGNFEVAETIARYPVDRFGDFEIAQDRKSTRLNSSHSQISYAVFCLKKKTVSRNSRYPKSS